MSARPSAERDGTVGVEEPTPLVSIGLPVRNGARYLQAALESLSAQTFTDFEVIICDNASTDATRAICLAQQARDGRFRYVANERDLGASPNFNRTFALARGRYFKWAAHDDVIAPTYLERAVEVLERDPTVVLCHAETEPIDERGEPLGFGGEAAAACRDRGYLDPPRRLDADGPVTRFADIVLRTRWCYEVFGLMRAAALRRTPRLTSLYGSDHVLLAELALAGRFSTLGAPLFRRRFHDATSTALPSGRAREVWTDTSAAPRRLPPALRFTGAFVAAIARAPIRPHEKLACHAVVGRWLLQAERLGHLWKRLRR